MKVWLITLGEPVPMGAEVTARLHRTGMAASYLARQGHNVVWWSSAFDHFKKKFIVDNDTTVCIEKNLNVVLFKGCGYNNNISLRRFFDQNLIAKKLATALRTSIENPDIIICAVPPVELAAACVKYGAENNIPTLLDLRDMWPDIFIDHAPKGVRWAARLLLFPLFRQARKTFSGASAIIGITERFVDWGISKTGRVRTSWDASFPFAYNTVPPAEAALSLADEFWNKKGISVRDDVFRICFFGTLSRQFDIPTAIKASKMMREKGIKAQFVICGDGDKFMEFKRLSQGNPDMIFPGWVDAAAIYSLMRRSSIGFAPLPDRYDYLATINNKSVEYLSAGLPIISCPVEGTLFDFLEKNKCGLSFTYGNASELVNIIAGLMKNPIKLKQMSANALKAFEENFTAENVHHSLMRHLELVVKEFHSDSHT